MAMLNNQRVSKQTGLERRIRYHLWQLEPNFRQGSQGHQKKKAPGTRSYHPSILSLTTLLTHVDPCWPRSIPTSRQQSHGDRQQVPGNFKAYQTTWSCHKNPKASGNHDISWPRSWMLLLLFICCMTVISLSSLSFGQKTDADVTGDIEMINPSRAHVRSSGRRCLEKQRHRKVCFTRAEAFETFVFFFDAWDMLRCNDDMNIYELK